MNALQSLKKQLAKLREEKEPIIVQLQNRIESQEQMIRKLTDKLLTYQDKVYIDQVSTLDNLDLVFTTKDGTLEKRYVIIDITPLEPEAYFIANTHAKIMTSKEVQAFFYKDHTSSNYRALTNQNNSEIGKQVVELHSIVSQLRVQINELKRKYEENIDHNMSLMTANNKAPQRKETFSTPEILLKESSLGWSSDKSKLDPIKQEKKSFDLSIAEISSQSLGDDRPKDKSLSDSPDTLRKQNSLPPQMQVLNKEKIKSGKSDDKKNLIMEQEKQSESERDKNENIQQIENAEKSSIKKENEKQEGQYLDLSKPRKSRGKSNSKKQNELKLTTFLDRNDSNFDEKIEKAPFRTMINSDSQKEQTTEIITKTQPSFPPQKSQIEEVTEVKTEISKKQKTKQAQNQEKPQKKQSYKQKNGLTSLDASIVKQEAIKKQEENKKPQAQSANGQNKFPSNVQIVAAESEKKTVKNINKAQSSDLKQVNLKPVQHNLSIELKLANASPRIQGRSDLSQHLTNMSETQSVGSFQLVSQPKQSSQNIIRLQNSVELQGKAKGKDVKAEGGSNASEKSSQNQQQKPAKQSLSPIKVSHMGQLSQISQISQNQKSNKNSSATELNNLWHEAGDKLVENKSQASGKSQQSKQAIPIQLIQSISSNTAEAIPESHKGEESKTQIRETEATSKLPVSIEEEQKSVPEAQVGTPVQPLQQLVEQQQKQQKIQPKIEVPLAQSIDKPPSIKHQTGQKELPLHHQSVVQQKQSLLSNPASQKDSTTLEKPPQQEKVHTQEKDRESKHKKKQKHGVQKDKSTSLNWNSLFSTPTTKKEKKNKQVPKTSSFGDQKQQSKESVAPKQVVYETPKKQKDPKSQQSQKNQENELLAKQLQKTPVWKLESPQSQPEEAPHKLQAKETVDKQNQVKVQGQKTKTEQGNRYSFQRKPQEVASLPITPELPETEKPRPILNEKQNEQYEKLKKEAKEAEIKQQEELQKLLQQLNQEQQKEKAKNKTENLEPLPTTKKQQQKPQEHEQTPEKIEQIDLNSQIKQLFNFGSQPINRTATKSEQKRNESTKESPNINPPPEFINKESHSDNEDKQRKEDDRPRTPMDDDKLHNFMVISADFSEKSDKNKNEEKQKLTEVPIEVQKNRSSQKLLQKGVTKNSQDPSEKLKESQGQKLQLAQMPGIKKKPTITIRPMDEPEPKAAKNPGEQESPIKTPYPQPYMKKLSDLWQKQIATEMTDPVDQAQLSEHGAKNEDRPEEPKFGRQSLESKAAEEKKEEKRKTAKIIHFRKGT